MKLPRKRLAALTRQGRSGVNQLLGRAGLRLTRTDKVIVDLRTVCDDPIEASYRAGLRPYVIEVQLEHCRVLPGTAFACMAGCGNPFVDTLAAHAAGAVGGYEASPLAGFYRAWQPRHAAQVLGLDGDGVAAPALRQAPPLGFVMPWNSWTPAQAAVRWAEFIEADNREHAGSKDAAAGWKSWGPVDPAIGAQEYARLTGVFESIRTQGYRRTDDEDGDIKGVALHADGAFRVLVTAGHHRAAALAALGLETAPIRIDNALVRRGDVAAWPNVRSGLFTVEQALALFDRLFDGRQPAGCHWPPSS